MDFLDYREKLKIAFNDEMKNSYLMTKVFNILETVCKDTSTGLLDIVEYHCFCNVTGTHIDQRFCTGNGRFRHCIDVLKKHTTSIVDFLSYYIAFVNAVNTEKNGMWNRFTFITLITRMMKEAHIPYELLKNGEEYFIFPKGANELDNALVSEPLEWLKGYSKAHKTYCIALH
ncbi:MAG: hypothetical protein PHU31_02315 [Anaerotignum sp.]|nr:hypothetical protein [Anaerotignum sp.]